MNHKKPIIIIGGPTACGKTQVSIELAKKINGEIISADSMQVYKYMDIGTAKATKEEMQGINHYLIDELYPDEEYSAAVFQDRARVYIDEILAKGKMPVIVGGTGFYINGLLYETDFTQTAKDSVYREHLYETARINGNAYLHSLLRQVDSESADKIHPNNIQRVIRALEYYQQTNKRISEHNAREKLKEPAYTANVFILHINREALYRNIDRRVDLMLDKGLVREVDGLLNIGYNDKMVSMQGIGYKEIIEHIKGKTSLDKAVDQIKLNTRHFAKRQLTWFSRQIEGKWLDVNQFSNVDRLVYEMVCNLGDH